MCKATNITQVLLQDKKKYGFIDHVNDCEIGNCDFCKKELCWEADFITSCELCKLDICIDCRQTDTCDICYKSFCKDCRTTIQVDEFVYCIECKLFEENEFYNFLCKNDSIAIERLLNENVYSQSFIDIMFINSIFHYNIQIISWLFDRVSSQSLYLKLAFNSCIASRAFNTQKEYNVVKFLLSNSEIPILNQCINYFVNHPEYKYTNDILEYIESIEFFN